MGAKKINTYAYLKQPNYLADEVTKEPDNEGYDPKHFKVVSSITGGYQPRCVMSANAQT